MGAIRSIREKPGEITCEGTKRGSSSKRVLLKTAFFRNSMGENDRGPREERRNAGCYQVEGFSGKTGHVDRNGGMKAAAAALAGRAENRAVDRRISPGHALSGRDGPV